MLGSAAPVLITENRWGTSLLSWLRSFLGLFAQVKSGTLHQAVTRTTTNVAFKIVDFEALRPCIAFFLVAVGHERLINVDVGINMSPRAMRILGTTEDTSCIDQGSLDV